VIFTLIAPILMLFHTKFVVLTLCRQSVSWGTQRRGGAGAAAWREAASAHAGQTLFGVLLAVIAMRISPALAAWMSPLLAGTILSIPISVLTGDTELGLKLRRRGIFITPEELDPPAALLELARAMAEPPAGRLIPADLAAHGGLLQAVLDPYVNAAHVSLLRAKEDPPVATTLRLAELRDRLVRDGPEALTKPEITALLADVDSMVELHERIWAARAQQLAPWWQEALEHYQIIAPSPQTAFTPAA
jgi:membrane glycosyltransferase